MAGAIMLSGCQNMSDTQTTQLQGAGGGALIGGVLGLVLGGAKGAAIGAAAGGALGLGVGSVVAERKRQYANAESFYDAQIQATRSRNRQLAQYNDGLARQIAEYRRDIASLRTQISAGSASNQVAIRTNERLQASYAQAKKMLADERHELDVQQRVAEEMRQSKGEQDARTQQEKQRSPLFPTISTRCRTRSTPWQVKAASCSSSNDLRAPSIVDAPIGSTPAC